MRFVLLSPVLSQPFLGFRLPAVVDLNTEASRIYPNVGTPDPLFLALAEAEVISSAKLAMAIIPCNASLPAHGIYNYCGASASVGEASAAIRDPPVLNSFRASRNHLFHVPLLSVLAFVEGAIPAARALVEGGVDYAALTTLSLPRCDILRSPEVTIPPNPALAPIKEHIYRFFLAEWDARLLEVRAITRLTSPKLGTISLAAHHRQSLLRTFEAAHAVAREMHERNCTVKLTLVAAGWGPVKIRAVYGRSARPLARLARKTENAILPNAGFPTEYFAAIAKCLLPPVEDTALH